jgi:hypothetical protein
VGSLLFIGGMPLKELETPALLFLSFLFPGHHQVRSSLTMMCCLTTGPKAMGSSKHGLFDSKTVSQKTFPLFKVILSGILLQ